MTRALATFDPVGLREIADRSGVPLKTVRMWRWRAVKHGDKPARFSEHFPPPRWHVNGVPAWDWTLDVQPWLTAHRERHGRRIEVGQIQAAARRNTETG